MLFCGCGPYLFLICVWAFCGCKSFTFAIKQQQSNNWFIWFWGHIVGFRFSCETLGCCKLMLRRVFDLHCYCFVTDVCFGPLQIAQYLANNMSRNWPRDLYEKVARSLWSKLWQFEMPRCSSLWPSKFDRCRDSGYHASSCVKKQSKKIQLNHDCFLGERTVFCFEIIISEILHSLHGGSHLYFFFFNLSFLSLFVSIWINYYTANLHTIYWWL